MSMITKLLSNLGKSWNIAPKDVPLLSIQRLPGGITTRYEDTDPAITYSGTWASFSSASHSGGTARYSVSSGAYAEFTFYGTSITWYSPTANNKGIASVSVDGGTPVDVDCYSSTTVYKKPVFTKTGLPRGIHKIRVTVTNRKNAASTDYLTHVDAFDVTCLAPYTMATITDTDLVLHNTAYSPELVDKDTLVLDDYTITGIASELNRLGYTTTILDNTFGSRKASLLMQVTNQVIVSPYTVTGFTSNLWQALYPISRILAESEISTTEALSQLYLGATSGKFMDYWATFFNVNRRTGETDAQLRRRIFAAMSTIKTNNIAIQQLVHLIINSSVTVSDVSPGQFNIELHPDFITVESYVKSVIDDIRAAGIMYTVSYSGTGANTEYYGAWYKDVYQKEFQNADVATITATVLNTEAKYPTPVDTYDIQYYIYTPYVETAGIRLRAGMVLAGQRKAYEHTGKKAIEHATMTMTQNGTVIQTGSL